MISGRAARLALGGVAIALAAIAAWWSFHYGQDRHHWREARLALQKHDADQARVHLAACLVRWNEHPEVHFLAAQAARLAGQYDEAEAHLSFCEQQKGVPPGELRRERALLQVQQGDFRGYVESLTPRGPNDPTLPTSVLEAMARGSEATLFFDYAERAAKRVLDREPDHPRVQLLMGDLLVKKHPHAALPHYQTAVRVLPDSLTPRLRLAECLLNLGECREAASQLGVLQERFPNSAEVLLAEARLHEYRGQADEASACLQRLLASHRDHIDALVFLGRLEYRRGNATAARTWLQRAVEVHPDQQEAWEALAWCDAELADPSAEQHSRAEAARIAQARGDATRIFLLTLQESAPVRERRTELAECYERLHEPATAITWHLCALHIDKDRAATHRALADLYEQTGQSHRAARHRALAGG
jgi:tetratricopeptide (TPR) repeat protein